VHAVTQVPVPSQIPLRQATAVLHGPPFGSPHLLSAGHVPAAHCVARAHVWPTPRTGAHVPPLQYVPAAHVASVVHVPPHLAPLHVPLRHVTADVHVVPSGSPHFPSALHSFDAHWVARAHVCPLASVATHAPLLQYSPAAHCPSWAHVATHDPLAQTLLLHEAPLTHGWPSRLPHRPSVSQTPLRQSPALVHVAPLSAPQMPSSATQIPERHAAWLEQLSPFSSPHLPSESHTPLRQAAADVHVAPFGLPHSWSASVHTPLRHVAAALHGRPLGVPHKLSTKSQTPLTQASRPVPVVPVQIPFNGGTDGIGCPFGTFGTHVPAPVALVGLLHHCALVQSVKTVHCVPHAPLEGLQIGPPCVAPTH
jgi:hypothetical protein